MIGQDAWNRLVGLGVLLLCGVTAASAETVTNVEKSRTEVRQDIEGDQSTVEEFPEDLDADQEPLPAASDQADAGWSQAAKLDLSDWGAHPHLAGPLGLSFELTQAPSPAWYGR